MRASSSLFVCLLLGAASVALPQSSSDTSYGVACALESGAANRLCKEYCEEKACHLANDRDPDTEPKASAAECEQTGARFRQVAGRDAPCDDLAACPCADPMRWGADMLVGFTWQNFALRAFNPVDTTCIDDSSQTTLEEDTPDYDASSAGVDTVLTECVVVDGVTKQRTTLSIGPKGAASCRRLLRRAAGELCSAAGRSR